MPHIPRLAAAPLALAAALALAAGDTAAQTPKPRPTTAAATGGETAAPPATAAPATAPDAAPAAAEAPPAAAPPAEAAAAGALSLGEVVEEEQPIGSTYVAAEFGDWQMTCTKTELGADPCQLYQLLQDQEGNSVAEIVVFGLPEGSGPAAAGATLVTPLETFLPAQITLRVDAGPAKRYPFTFCAAIGCVSRIGLTAEEVAAFQRGNVATMVIVPAVAPDQQVAVEISLRGFTAGFEAVNAANRAAEAAATAAAAAAGAAAPATPP
jgi:invasion protein IalB